MAPPSDAPEVVVVGAGPVGLSLAIELGNRGIHCLIVERDDRRGWAPRAKTTHCRTREHMRRWGIAEKLAEASPFGIDYPSHVLFVTRLGGHLLKRFEHALDCRPDRNEDYSEHGQWVPQYKLESVLLEHVRNLPTVSIRNGCTFESFTQDDAGVAVTLRDANNGVEVIEASYLVGADGARSGVRDAIGAQMVGTYGLSRNFNVIFRAPDLAKLHRHGPGIMYWQINSDVPSLIGPMDRDDLWFFMPTGVSVDLDLSPEAAADTIRQATGIETEIEVLSSDEWVASRFIADSYAKGRAFLVGDACHLHPPFGGFGMNLGISDSVDLGWKLAATLRGWGGQDLLSSYEIERRQAHEIVLDAAEANHSTLANQLARPGIEDASAEGAALRTELSRVIEETKRAEFYARGVVLGYCYRNSPVVADDGTQDQWQRSIDYVPLAIPGSIAPHRWLADGSSLYDHFGSGLTLLATTGTCEEECLKAAQEAEALGVPLKVLDLRHANLAPLYEASLILIRPDQHVAWRGSRWPGEGLIKQVLGGL
ncbi:FAD-dependent monooxygenase [Tritonibacter horizontis]|uniref:2,4-dichlorophenol 6-monooxygenase n=1 Tax=Tritonibacter horizontis TaxID=1768241 RepID=A0A132BU88_9RHOB|nr:FAD-dependent monooxygenase [Tritonibacter horizontis]KUP91948.1 2,4-dichlorophenol 6-monooxygenase [Tritonibacter horizontis]